MCKQPRIENLNIEELLATADRWYTERKIRAVEECINWKMLPDGTLVHKTEEDKQYACADVIWGQTSGTALAFIGCDCKDHDTHLDRMRQLLGCHFTQHPVHCKHAVMRCLFAGHTIYIPGWGKFKLRENLLK